MKKKALVLILGLLCLLGLAACGGSETPKTTTNDPAAYQTTGRGGVIPGGSVTQALQPVGTTQALPAGSGTHIDTMTVMYVPARSSEDILVSTADLGELLISSFRERGFDIGNVVLRMSEDYTSCGMELAAGTVDVAYLPGSVYAMYGDEVQLALTATRDMLSNDSTIPSEWNGEANKSELLPGVPVGYYKSLIYAAPTDIGQALAAKVNAGGSLTWDDIAGCRWAVGPATSAHGHIYPNLWLKEHFDKKLTDLPQMTVMEYPEAFRQAAAGQVDIIVCYADGRMDYEAQWQASWGRPASIWNELNVVGVTPNIYNDTLCLSRAGVNRDVLTNPHFIKTFQEIMMKLPETEEGQRILGVYSHTGYMVGQDSDYEITRNAINGMR